MENITEESLKCSANVHRLDKKQNFFDLPEAFSPLTFEQRKLYVSGADFPFCTSVAKKYEMICKLGQGTFGEVYKAREKGTSNFYALKKIPTNAEYGGLPLTALREIRILQQLQHENIIAFIEICVARISSGENCPGIFYIVLEFCDYNLEFILNDRCVKLTSEIRRTMLKQLLCGLCFMHSIKILHRDIKAANILITKVGVLKIADFGLARIVDREHFELKKPFSNRVVTLWYRAPELLLGDRWYSSSIDIWSVGCLMAELWTRTPILNGATEQEQLYRIFHLCGSITKENWPGVERLPLYSMIDMPRHHKRHIKERLGKYFYEVEALDLLDKMLTLDPLQRISARSALSHEFFYEEPSAESLASFLINYRKLKMQPNLMAPLEQCGSFIDRIF